MPVLAAYVVPHPPMIVPEVGKGSEERITRTIQAYRQVADEIAALRPETIVISSPHSVMYSDYFHISPGKGARGDFSAFGAGKVRFDETFDQELAGAVCDLARTSGFPAGTLGEKHPELDHGTMVPLYFIRRHDLSFRLVRIGLSGLSLPDHYRLGEMIREAVEKTGRRIVYIASGDLSHKLQPYGPYGYAEEGPAYDGKVMDALGRGAFRELLTFDENLCEKAAECGHRSFVIMAGLLDGVAVEAKALSHEDVTGVGYGICTFHPKEKDESRHFLRQYLDKEAEEIRERQGHEDPFVRLARETIGRYLRGEKRIRVPENVPEEMQGRAGVFVSVHEHGRLRGCIGTILPTEKNIAGEIVRNAVSAVSQDPRFEPVRPDEEAYLTIHVDVLSQPERIVSEKDLDVRRYGVIVTNGTRRGLLLPDLDGVDTVSQQVAIARRKAGIGKDEPVTLERFEVIRHE